MASPSSLGKRKLREVWQESIQKPDFKLPGQLGAENRYGFWVGRYLGGEDEEILEVIRERASLSDLQYCNTGRECIDFLLGKDDSSSPVTRGTGGTSTSLGHGLARNAFLNYQFQNQSSLDYLWQRIQDDYEQWITPGTKYVAPFFAIVQSSGWGKSRLVSELHQKNAYVIYCSLMDDDSGGFPGRTPDLADWICNRNVTPEKVGAFMIASLRVLKVKLEEAEVRKAKVEELPWEDYSSDPGTWLSDQMEKLPDDALGTWLKKHMAELDDTEDGDRLRGQMVELAKVDPETWLKQQIDPNMGFPIAVDIRKKLEDCLEELQSGSEVKAREESETSKGQKTYARERTNKFAYEQRHSYTAIRDALGKAVDGLPVDGVGLIESKKMKVIFCFDEATSLTKTELTNEWDTAFTLLRRVLSMARSGIFALTLGTNSRLSNFAPSSKRDPSTKVRFRDYKLFRPFWLTGSAVQPGSPTNILSYGRPMWRAFLAKGCSDEELVEMAKDKLISRKTLKITDEFVISVLGCSIGFEVASWAQAAELSVAHHMMTAAWIAEERDRIHISNGAEPVLAAAAAMVLKDEKTLNDVIVRLGVMCKQGVVTGGPRGEIVTRLVLLLAMYKCMEDKNKDIRHSSVTLGQFLTKLFGKIPDGLSQRVDLTATLEFNAFVPTYALVSSNLIQQCHKLGYGLTCKPGEVAVDCVLRSSRGNIGVQAKRWETDNTSKIEEGIRNVRFSLGLVFQLGSPQQTIKVEGKQGKTIVVRGFSRRLFPHLSSETVDAIAHVLQVRPIQYLMDMKQDEKKLLNDMLPVIHIC